MAADPKGFLKVKREDFPYRPVCERIKDWRHVVVPSAYEKSRMQATRCMDCGTPFCNWGCPLANLIPEWNEYMALGLWQEAAKLLAATNNLPEITGRICPAPCEYSCVLGINDDPVTIRENELAIIEYAFKHAHVHARSRQVSSGKRVAVVGSGPAGLAAAAQLSSVGHKVVVFEKDAKPGGLMRYGIPDFKLEKWILDRRIHLYKKEGIEFVVNTQVGKEYAVNKMLAEFDAVCLACGSRTPRDLNIEGRELQGIHFAMEYLTQANQLVSQEISTVSINAKGKKVVVIGGGDTGADCVGTAHRQGAQCVVQIEVMPQPSECRTDEYPWPQYPLLLKVSTSHQEGGDRQWAVLTERFVGRSGVLTQLDCVKVEFVSENNSACPVMKKIPGSEFSIAADLVILAIGFLHPEHNELVNDLSLALDKRGNIHADAQFMTNKRGVFTAGDMHRGQSLIVWGLTEGRRAAHHIDSYLQGKKSILPLI